VHFVSDLGQSHASRGEGLVMVGDLSQPRGGLMSNSRRIHQNGLDADIWFQFAVSAAAIRDTENQPDPPSMLAANGEELGPLWGDDQKALLKAAADDPRVDRIFVNPAIKRALCSEVEGDRGWLAKIRPWWGHDAHFHVGLHCPPDSTECLERQPPVPDGDGCDASLDWWFSAAAREELRKGAGAPRPRLTLEDLPAACRAVLTGE